MPTPDNEIEPWGRVTKATHTVATPAFLSGAGAALTQSNRPTLALGCARSYGDVCLNAGNELVRMTALDRLISADWTDGVVRAEAGLTLDALLRVAVPKGWFLPVTPGTKFVTLGGAVANDVHGKNHESAGTIGCHVRRIGLVRSSGDVLELSEADNADLFQATIGGLGLTGLMLWVELTLKKIESSFVEVETLAISDLDHFFRLAEDSAGWEHTVAWVDCLATGKGLGRGLFMRGRHSAGGGLRLHGNARIAAPFDAPPWLLNAATVSLFNLAYRRRPWILGRHSVHYDPFFYPLDAVGRWNRFYGARGFFQHQCAVPKAAAPGAIERLLRLTGEHRQGSFLVVLKLFGARKSPGLLSFPMEGATLALDLPNRGETTRKLLADMTAAVMEAGGRVYPAKDATMSAAAFRSGFPEWRRLAALRDPKIMSDFWRRVAQ
ncbi:MAG TPA: FAD-binding oxidoreductase [Pseudolabrys sp.]|nr:FAD-binding oxidoreductase [Pseudolabrys sp.]